MNIRRRMSRGFGLLIGLCTIIGIASIIQISSMNASIDDLTQNKMVTIESTKESKFNLKNMKDFVTQYEEGIILGVIDKFNESYEPAIYNLNKLRTLHSHLTTEITALTKTVDTTYNVTMSSTDGIFYLLDSYWIAMSVINTEIDAAKIEINSLISQQNETSMILKATGSIDTIKLGRDAEPSSHAPASSSR